MRLTCLTGRVAGGWTAGCLPGRIPSQEAMLRDALCIRPNCSVYAVSHRATPGPGRHPALLCTQQSSKPVAYVQTPPPYV